jgi:hypothetical protein
LPAGRWSRPAEEVHVVHIQGDQLADAHPGAVERFENRAIAGAQPRVGRRRVEKALDFFVFEEARQLLFLLGRLDAHDGIGADVIALDEEFVKASQRGELACGGRLGVLLTSEVRHINANALGVCFEDGLFNGGVGLRFSLRLGHHAAGVGPGLRVFAVLLAVETGGEEVDVLLEIRAVTLCGMRGEVPLELEIAEEFLNDRAIFHSLPFFYTITLLRAGQPMRLLRCWHPADDSAAGTGIADGNQSPSSPSTPIASAIPL